ncbi:hypothetical protein [Duganella callida]|uniref:Uncharacterized protein n=1 Tax=Duganella callida TaxID=2561932 RepID=A0A4Y9SG38_9BURK|nr:hypothetical protein [Duganella callida]TFW22787.1 hypothetical protein E4L98_11750 [Duganella callida]
MIEGQAQGSYSILPQGTVLYYDRNWDEGHGTYHVYFHFKGELKATEVAATGIDPIWLRTVEAEELPKLLHSYPVSRSELVSILKARQLSRLDVLEILRGWED